MAQYLFETNLVDNNTGEHFLFYAYNETRELASDHVEHVVADQYPHMLQFRTKAVLVMNRDGFSSDVGAGPHIGNCIELAGSMINVDAMRQRWI